MGLSMLFDGLTERLVLVELDEKVASVWEAILGGHAEELVERIGHFQVSRSAVKAVLNDAGNSLLDRAFGTIVRNRVQRGGILAPGASLMKYGEGGRGVASRWYPKTLQTRIQDIAARKESITFLHGDGVEYMRKNAERDDMVFFVDPPYAVAGRRLYAYSEVDHKDLFGIASTLRGDLLMTYDEAPPTRYLAGQFGFDVHTVPMKNTHHRVMRELLIGRDLGWARV